MKSRLITALAIGALAVGMLPSIASAEPGFVYDNGGTTDVNVTVVTGSTIWVPAAIDFNSVEYPGAAFPGVSMTTLKPAYDDNPYIAWYSNEEGKHVSASMPDLRNAEAGQTIADEDVSLWLVSKGASNEAVQAGAAVADFGGTAVPVGTIVDVATETREDPDFQAFALQIVFPSADEGTYTTEITWTVQ